MQVGKKKLTWSRKLSVQRAARRNRRSPRISETTRQKCFGRSDGLLAKDRKTKRTAKPPIYVLLKLSEQRRFSSSIFSVENNMMYT